MPCRDYIAMKVLMKYEPAEHFDSGEDGFLSECRSCRFHRPYARGQTCVFRTCPYCVQPLSTRKPLRWILAYANPIQRR